MKYKNILKIDWVDMDVIMNPEIDICDDTVIINDMVFVSHYIDVGEDGLGHTRFCSDGSKQWRENGVLHRENGPAIIRADGKLEWWKNGLLHRENGPAIIDAAGMGWYKDGVPHRDDGPAIIYYYGEQQWWQNGVRIK